MDYKELINRLRYSRTCADDIAEAATAIETLLAERETQKQQGGWIKATPETMPPDMKPVMTTVNSLGKKYLWLDVRWNGHTNSWEVLDDFGSWAKLDDKEDVVTHWMPYPNIAKEDD